MMPSLRSAASVDVLKVVTTQKAERLKGDMNVAVCVSGTTPSDVKWSMADNGSMRTCTCVASYRFS